MKISTDLLPIKAHFFFFFAALGPILPQLNVFGRQLGASPAAMGLVTAVLPLLWALAKPAFGYLVDYFTNQRKFVFMLLIVVMTGSYCGLWFLSPPKDFNEKHIIEYVYQMNDTLYLKNYNTADNTKGRLKKYNCQWNCLNRTEFTLWLSNSSHVSTMYIDGDVNINVCSKYHMDFDEILMGEVKCRPNSKCDLNCVNANHTENVTSNTVPKELRNGSGAIVPCSPESGANDNTQLNDQNNQISTKRVENDHVTEKSGESNPVSPKTNEKIPLSTSTIDAGEEHGEDSSFYLSATFWVFVVLMCVGTVAFNVANCIGDAVCFDVLGLERGNKYGSQRAWGTAGYGITALLGGWLIDTFSKGHIKDFTPAFILALAFTALDLMSCRKLNLPRLSSPSDSGRALKELLKMPRVLVFITFAVIAGIFDSFIIYYMFWYLEELAEISGRVGQIKLIEGVIVAAQSFVGELLFFYLSGWIIRRWGHSLTMSVSLVCYSIRLAFISLLTDPWILVFTEAIMQGPTYALMYATIVGYAAHVAPEGYSATVQGIVAGMDDGLGFALGSLIGGQLYACVGGAGAFRAMAAAGLIAAVAHCVLTRFVVSPEKQTSVSSVKAPKPSIDDIAQEEHEKMLHQEDNPNVIYRDTVVAISGDKSKSAARL